MHHNFAPYRLASAESLWLSGFGFLLSCQAARLSLAATFTKVDAGQAKPDRTVAAAKPQRLNWIPKALKRGVIILLGIAITITSLSVARRNIPANRVWASRQAHRVVSSLVLSHRHDAFMADNFWFGNLLDGRFCVQPILKGGVNERCEKWMRSERL